MDSDLDRHRTSGVTNWKKIPDHYDPLLAGSIDGTDTVPHDRAISRAMSAVYMPPELRTKAESTIFVGSLPYSTDEFELERKFSAFGRIKHVKLVRDLVTGFSKGYGFIEFSKETGAEKAYKEGKYIEFNGKNIIVDYEICRVRRGWIPRRLGGGYGGKKESGQLRFGCRVRPFKRPIIIGNPDTKKKCDSHSSRNWKL